MQKLPNKVFISAWAFVVFAYGAYSLATGTADLAVRGIALKIAFSLGSRPLPPLNSTLTPQGYKEILDGSQLAAASLVDASLMSVLIIGAV